MLTFSINKTAQDAVLEQAKKYQDLSPVYGVNKSQDIIVDNLIDSGILDFKQYGTSGEKGVFNSYRDEKNRKLNRDYKTDYNVELGVSYTPVDDFDPYEMLLDEVETDNIVERIFGEEGIDYLLIERGVNIVSILTSDILQIGDIKRETICILQQLFNTLNIDMNEVNQPLLIEKLLIKAREIRSTFTLSLAN